MRTVFLYLFLLTPLVCFGQIELVSEDQLYAINEQLESKLTALELAEEGEEFTALVDLGDLYRKQRSYKKAATYYQRALGFVDFSSGGFESLVSLQNRLGRVLFADANYQEAMEAFEEAQALSISSKASSAGYDNISFRARALVQLGRIEEAIETYRDLYDYALETYQDTTSAIDALAYAAELYNLKGDYENTISIAQIASRMESACAGGENIKMLTEHAIALNETGRQKQSIALLYEAETLAKGEIAFVQKKIAEMHLSAKHAKDALKYVNKAINNAELRNNTQLLIELHTLKADILASLKKFEDGISAVQKSVEVKEALRTKQLIDNSRRLRIEDFLTNAENQFRQGVLQAELESADVQQAMFRKKSETLERKRQELEEEKKEKELQLAKAEAERNEVELRAVALEKEQVQQSLALLEQSTLALQIQRDNERLEQQRLTDSLAAANEQQVQLRKNEVLEQEKIIAQNQAEQQKAANKRNKWIAAFMGLGLLTAIGFYVNTRRLNRQVESERERAEQLLLNVLPKSIAEELKESGVAAPLKYESATVLFTDFVGFTSISSQLAPEEIIEELNVCFTAFDDIVQRHNLEKIKTIGDSYMCAGGIPDANTTHALDAVKAGQEMVAFMNQRNAQHKANQKMLWPIRVGVHTGELVAGVVGTSKFAYDIWGDTVNVASRMERGAVHDSINVSESTYQKVSAVFDCEFRGEIEVKNRGKMGMYRIL